MFGKLLKTVADVAALPVEIAKDVVNVGDDSRAEKQAVRISKDAKELLKEIFGE